MQSERWEKIQALFHRAIELPDSERQAFVEAACGGDGEVLSEVSRMLRSEALGASLLDRGVAGIASEIVGSPGDSITFREFGPYRLKQVLGEGGMGVVWLAERTDAGNLVAIKFLPHASLSPARRDRFAREIKTLAKLKHPSIARLYDAGTLADGTPWFVMEYVEGVPFAEYVRQRNISIADKLRLFRRVCEAVQYAHGQAIIHRDLKPSNILVEPDGTPRLLDFGIARELHAIDDAGDQTRPGLRFMSPHYAAPEWIRDGDVGLYTDVYSLGVILYEMLAGRLPFNDNASDSNPGKPSAFARSTGLASSGEANTDWNDLDLLCLKAMHREHLQRYRSVEALIRDIDHFLESEPLEARPDSLRYRTGKFIARNLRPVLATSLAAILLTGMGVFFTVRLANARNSALAEAARTRHIQRFMLDLFGAGDREAAPSSQLRVTTLLDRGARQAGSLSSDPETQAELYQSLGTMSEMLGKFEQADKLLGLAVEKMKAALGPEDPRVADAIAQLALLRGDEARFPEARKLAEESVRIAGAGGNRMSEALLNARSTLGRVLAQSGLYENAVSVLDPIVKTQPVGEEGTITLLESLTALGYSHQYLGHYAEAESLHHRALELDRRLHGDSYPRVGYDFANIGTTQISMGKNSEAERSYREALRIVSAWYGDDNPDVTQIRNFVALSLVQEGKYEDADALMRLVLARQEQTYGQIHPYVENVLQTLGKLALKRGRLTEAETDFARGLAIDKALFGEQVPQTAVAEINLADILVKQQQYGRAEPMLRQAVTVLLQHPSPGSANLAIAQVLLGRVLVRQKQFQEAEQYLAPGYAFFVKQPQRGPARLVEVRNDLAESYEALQQPAKAAALRAESPGSGVQKIAAANR